MVSLGLNRDAPALADNNSDILRKSALDLCVIFFLLFPQIFYSLKSAFRYSGSCCPSALHTPPVLGHRDRKDTSKNHNNEEKSPSRTAVLAQYPPGRSYPFQHLLGHLWGRSGRGTGPSLHVCSSSCRIAGPSPREGQTELLQYMGFCTVEKLRLSLHGGCPTSTPPPLFLVTRLSLSCG